MTAVNAFLRFCAFLILILVVLALPLSLLAFDAGQLVFDANTIKSLVGDNLLSAEFIGRLAQRATAGALDAEADTAGDPAQTAEAGEGESLETALLQEGLGHLEEEDWIEIAGLIAPPDVVEDTVDDLVDAYVAWLDNDQDFPRVNLDLTEWKLNARQHASEVVQVVMEALPQCSVEGVLNQALESLTGGEGLAAAIPVCRPPEPLYGTLLNNADAMVLAVTQRAPDEIDTQLLQSGETPEELLRFKENLQRARLILRWSWVVVSLAGLLAVAMAARSWPQALAWAGWPALLAGGITLLLGLGIQFLAGGGLERLIAWAFADAPVTLSAVGSTVVQGVLPLIGTPLLIQAGVLLALGLGAVIWARILAGRDDDDYPRVTDYA